ncbi:actin-related protein 10 isoform X2 [Belonocnema kinseyi]|uniref:actin-related protein 10 isoform X2 n=1 Tax=Belonocnema kinseyi TaxID=2817044 RepID=UPI00143D02EE|nr:actin-related protein 10 isoform X2 [Belonocnema kinseyi]
MFLTNRLLFSTLEVHTQRESNPRGIIRTEVMCTESRKIRQVFSYKNTEDLYQLLVEFLHFLFFRYTVISPKDVRVVVLESLLTPTQFRETLAKVLFRHFEIGSLMILPSHLVTISTLGVETAIILDVGYEDATLIPVFEGIPVLKAWQALPLASQAVHNCIKKEIKEAIPDLELSERIIEDIKVRSCFVTTKDRSTKLRDGSGHSPPSAVKYPGVKSFEIPGHVRENAFEILWERDNDNLTIPTMILDAIVKCPMDMRRPLAQNILLVGGTVMAKGFLSRLKSELIHLVNSDFYSDILKVRTFKFHTAPCHANYTTWLGGAIFGIADLPARCISKEKYLITSRVPDWSSLLDNRKFI